MAADLVALSFAAHDPRGLAAFWAGILGWETAGDDRGPALVPGDGMAFPIRFLPTEAPKTGPNQVHFDLTSQSLEGQEQTVARALRLGGRHLDVGQLPEEGHVVLADPEGNEFCVIEPSNNFLAGCGVLGALSGDGSREVGCFWSEALGWPLVWDQDEETAIQSPRGGTKLTWGGPPVRVKTGKNRLHLDLAARGAQEPEIARLLGLGARLLHADQGHDGSIALADPDGNEFCVVRPAGRD